MTASDPDDWEVWSKENPYPNLQALCEEYGSYGRVPEHIWKDYDRRCKAWDLERRDRFRIAFRRAR